jgi:peptide subunit release factor 1 (eRF1)
MYFQKCVTRFYEYLAAVFGRDYNQRIEKNIGNIQMNRKRDRMETLMTRKKVINPILTKRYVCDDKISTEPLRHADGSYF